MKAFVKILFMNVVLYPQHAQQRIPFRILRIGAGPRSRGHAFRAGYPRARPIGSQARRSPARSRRVGPDTDARPPARRPDFATRIIARPVGLSGGIP